MAKKVFASMGYQVSKIAADIPSPSYEPGVPEPLPEAIPAAEATPPYAPLPEHMLLVDMNNHVVLQKAALTYTHDLLYTYHCCDFIEEPQFRRAYELGKATDVSRTVLFHSEIYWRVHVLCWAASQARHLQGDFVDCGVNTGIFARAIIDYIDFNTTGKNYYLLDTFEGLDERYSTPDELAKDLNHNYTANKDVLYQQVCNTFKDFNVTLVKGAVPDTLPQVTSEKIAFLSVDMNCVQPEVAALHYFWDKLVPGGIIILDDYGYANAYTAQKNAHNAFAKSKGVEILMLPTCQGMIIKPFNSTKPVADTQPDTRVEFSLAGFDRGHHHITYREVPCTKHPTDYVLYQMLVHGLQPDLIIEIGTNRGGSALYLADLLDMNGKGTVHTMDVQDIVYPAVKTHPRIQFFSGGWEQYDLQLAQGYEVVLVIEDSSHTYANTLAVMKQFAPLVSNGSYLIVEDGIVDALGISDQFGGGPVKAIQEFLPENPAFELDQYWCDFFGKNATANTIGYLKKTIVEKQ